MLQSVVINGAEYYADVNNKILYTDRDKKSGTPFSFLTEGERNQMENELRFPKPEIVE